MRRGRPEVRPEAFPQSAEVQGKEPVRMLERRQEDRVRIEPRVKVSGVDGQGERFSEHAIATNISRSGALFSQIGAELRCGDLIAVDYEARRAHYRIVWIVDAGTRDGARIAIHRVGTRPCPWEELLPAETVVQ
jgi:hypothetical protein